MTITVVVEARIPSSFSLWECQMLAIKLYIAYEGGRNYPAQLLKVLPDVALTKAGKQL